VIRFLSQLKLRKMIAALKGTGNRLHGERSKEAKREEGGEGGEEGRGRRNLGEGRKEDNYP
jgi:hypothetical protein